MSQITCTWVPGTTDTVRLSTIQKTLKLPLRQIKTLWGEQAIKDLYLRGRFSKSITQAELDQLMKA
ncbi:hypothetical protein EHF33_12995 [Deinococcus psychrotolerans]|uniref:Uncharacterized protein n=2 Tax=Deinococcus TaxID=1298 RepID=A0A553V3X7_9DEIO|nr:MULTISPECIES: hypothetical protein [Deinococcus]AZI43552.1 hypothetical protein EHF33_12995 [Deinococcus psychrotolerans]TSA87200.1 hypothetical protein FNU79_04725 [Deinococcus detaillensis]